MRQAEIDGGVRPGTTTEDQRRIAELERENRELRRANETLRTASTRRIQQHTFLKQRRDSLTSAIDKDVRLVTDGLAV